MQLELPPRVRGTQPAVVGLGGPGAQRRTPRRSIDGLAAAARTWRSSDRRSGREALDHPAVGRAAVAEPVVQAARAALPELDLLGHDPEAAPERGSGHVVAGEALLDRGDGGLERGPVGQTVGSGRDAHAAIWLPRGRVGVVGVGLARGRSCSTVPRTRTWRCSSSQPNVRLAQRVGRQLRALAEPRLEKNVNPRSSAPRTSTKRASGWPSASTVARTIALGSVHPASTASSYQPLPLHDRVGIEIGEVEPGGLVLRAAVGDAHARQHAPPTAGI